MKESKKKKNWTQRTLSWVFNNFFNMVEADNAQDHQLKKKADAEALKNSGLKGENWMTRTGMGPKEAEEILSGIDQGMRQIGIQVTGLRVPG